VSSYLCAYLHIYTGAYAKIYDMIGEEASGFVTGVCTFGIFVSPFPITLHYRKRLRGIVAIGAGCLFPNNGNLVDYRKYI
jgi:hypothetical protein